MWVYFDAHIHSYISMHTLLLTYKNNVSVISIYIYLSISISIDIYISTDIYISIFDRNPYNWLETHPDHFKSNTWVWYWNYSSDKWLDIYSKSFEALKSIDEWIYDELNFIIQRIVPIWTDDFVHNSASYKESIWHLYMGMTNTNDDCSIVQCLEAVIHESSHNKLNLINKFDKILLNDFELKYYSPYRPDARHVWWTFIWIHAFVPTIYTLFRYYRQNNISNSHLLEKLVIYNIKNNLSLKVLSRYAKFTELWKEIMQEVKYVMTLTNKIIKELDIDNNITEYSKQKVISHFNEVKKKYPYLKY